MDLGPVIKASGFCMSQPRKEVQNGQEANLFLDVHENSFHDGEKCKTIEAIRRKKQRTDKPRYETMSSKGNYFPKGLICMNSVILRSAASILIAG